jgi:hypothetical protein
MPPRFTYWKIIFGGHPTAFRSGSRDELLPTFKQIQARHPDAQLRYFARGKLWYSEEEAQAALVRARFEKRERRPPSGPRPRPGQWKPRHEDGAPGGDARRPGGDGRQPRPEGQPKPEGWKPRREFHQPAAETQKPGARSWKPAAGSRKPEARSWKPKTGGWRPRPDVRKPEAESRKPEAGGWRPKAGGEHRARDWRPGGEHKDPRERFKVPRDVKRARMAKRFGWKKKDDK